MGATTLLGRSSFYVFRISCLLLVVTAGVCFSFVPTDQGNGENEIFRKQQLPVVSRTRRSVDTILRRLRIKSPEKKPMKLRSVFKEIEDGKTYHSYMTQSVKSAKSSKEEYESWAEKCVESFNEALEFYEFYEGTRVRCHHHCDDPSRIESIKSPIDQPAARQWEARIKQYFCFENCTKIFLNDRIDVISNTIFKEIELGELYFYLHDCYYVVSS